MCTQSFDVWRRIGNDSRSRVTDSASVWQQWVPAPHGALGQRVELALPADGPYSYEGDCVVVRLGRRRAPRRREARGRARAAVGGAVRLRVDVDGEPLAPGAAVSGRVVVEEGGGARSLSVRLAFVERTESFEKVARDAGALVVAEGDLADGAVARLLAARCPKTPAPNIATRHGRVGWELRARVDRAGPDPTVDRPIELQRGYTAPDRERWPSG